MSRSRVPGLPLAFVSRLRGAEPCKAWRLLVTSTRPAAAKEEEQGKKWSTSRYYTVVQWSLVPHDEAPRKRQLGPPLVLLGVPCVETGRNRNEGCLPGAETVFALARLRPNARRHTAGRGWRPADPSAKNPSYQGGRRVVLCEKIEKALFGHPTPDF